MTDYIRDITLRNLIASARHVLQTFRLVKPELAQDALIEAAENYLRRAADCIEDRTRPVTRAKHSAFEEDYDPHNTSQNQ